MIRIQRAVPVSTYRPDVDGLRSVAVVAVLLFHAFPALFPGGFVGVDVFFVISGFLITGNIIRGIEYGSFTISGFYLRRVRRIFPALLIVLGCCLIAGWVFFTAGDLMRLGKHTAAATLFAANFFYWAESGYFDGSAAAKPLLHLWSLGIEEQFYLMWPLFIVISQRKRNSRKWVLGVIAISFLACFFTTAPLSYAGFYSPASRMWELALGGILALTIEKKKRGADEAQPADWNSGHSWLAECGSIVGIGLILAAVWMFSGTIPYPGWRALLPTIGTALVISAGTSAFLNRWLLSHPVMVFVGLISYPLYLWHWPLLSFAHIIGLGIVPTSVRIGLLLASVVLASGTYLLLEQPLHRVFLSWRLGGALVAIMVCLGIAGATTYRTGGAKLNAQLAAAMADPRPLHAGVAVSAPAASVPPNQGDGDSDTADEVAASGAGESAPASTNTNTSKGGGMVAGTRPSPVLLYRRRVAEAARNTGNPGAYASEIGESRPKVVRSGVCEPANTESADGLKDGSVCGQFVPGAMNVLVLGDSIASDTYAWLHIAHPEYNLIQKTGIGCNLQRDFDVENPKSCKPVFESALKIALSPTEKLDAVVLASLWNQGFIGAEPLINKLLARGLKVILVGPPVGFTISAYEMVDKCPSSSKDGLTFDELTKCAREHATVYRETNTIMNQYAQKRGIPYVDVHALACNDSWCSTLDEDGQQMFTDTWHRSLPGDVWIARRIRENHVFERILGSQRVMAHSK